MMISPEGYYDEYLKGKTAEQIMTAIRGLKQEIGHLKNTMEHPEYGRETIMHPSEDVRLWCTRMYLERAKQALVEAGGIYTPSKVEMQVAEFEKSIPAIYKVVFSIGGFFSGHKTHTITLDDKHLHMDGSIPSSLNPPISLLRQIIPWEKMSSWRASGVFTSVNGAGPMIHADLGMKSLMAHSGN